MLVNVLYFYYLHFQGRICLYCRGRKARLVGKTSHSRQLQTTVIDNSKECQCHNLDSTSLMLGNAIEQLFHSRHSRSHDYRSGHNKKTFWLITDKLNRNLTKSHLLKLIILKILLILTKYSLTQGFCGRRHIAWNNFNH